MQMPIIDNDSSNYAMFPGPLNRSETIPSDVRAFLRTKLEELRGRMPADMESAGLLIGYLELLIKNRGVSGRISSLCSVLTEMPWVVGN